MGAYEEQVTKRLNEYIAEFNVTDPVLCDLILSETTKAAKLEMDAGYGGCHHDGGAGLRMTRLRGFIAGTQYHRVGLPAEYIEDE